MNFAYNGLPARVLFGRGTLTRLAELMGEIGGKRALLLSTPAQRGQVEPLLALLGDAAVGLFAEAAMHTPLDISERAVATAQRAGADCVIALGGGSTIGLGKAIALRTDLPQIAVPTTYAGSEVTPILGQTEGGRKTTQRTLKVLPEAVLYDVNLTLTLPASMSATSGLNAIAHAVEGLYARDGNPIVSLMAEEGVRALAQALPRIVDRPGDIEARSDALYGAWLCGTVLGSAGMALHHKLCHTLGGSFNLPHAETHAVVLPHATAYNAAAAPDAMARLSRALGVAQDPAGALFDLGVRLGAPAGLKALGMSQVDLDRAADLAVENPYWNPRPIERPAIRRLLQAAFDGDRPA
ncbi:MAG: maleylacetate reductase [Steroidobacteraceae bacterium]|jgi:alcohol dehydrogenase class IV